MIAGQDIAAEAARVISDTTWKGKHTLQLDGAADVSFDEAATAIGKAIGREVKHVEVPLNQAQEGMVAKGLSEEYVKEMLKLFTGFSNGWLSPAQGRTKGTTTPTTIEQFAREVMAPAFSVELAGTQN